MSWPRFHPHLNVFRALAAKENQPPSEVDEEKRKKKLADLAEAFKRDK